MVTTFASPPLPLFTAHLIAGFFATSYVGSLYVSKHTRLNFSSKTVQLQDGQERDRDREERWRNDPDVIRARMVAASLSTIASSIGVSAILKYLNERQNVSELLRSTLVRLGFVISPSLRGLTAGVLPCLIAPLLFLGPLYVAFLSETLPGQKGWSFKWSFMPMVKSWQGLRNYLFGPITEEVVFRACVLAIYHLAGSSHKKMIFLTPLWFGVAHLHHAWDTYNRFGRTTAALQRAVVMTVFQLGYTTLFGFHCAYLFLRTGSLLSPVLSHIFCNIMGLPGFASDVQRFPKRRYAVIVAYLLGIAGYIYTLPRWTQISDNLYWPTAGQVVQY